MLNFKQNQMFADWEAKQFLEGMPIGNGRIGTVIYGGVESETIELSESTIWSGKPREANCRPDSAQYLPELQQAIVCGDSDEKVAQLMAQLVNGDMADYGTSRPFGTLKLNFPSADFSDYSRSLDLETAIHTVTYMANGVKYTREAFVSHPDQVMVMRLTADKPGCVTFDMQVEPVALHGNTLENTVNENVYTVKGVVFDGDMLLCAKIAVLNQGGVLSSENDRLILRNADEALILLDIETDYLQKGTNPAILCEQRLGTAASHRFSELESRHKNDFYTHFNRLSIDLGKENDVYRFWFQYARYLAISACRSDSPMPMHLQGIWNDNMACNMPWTCDFHLDINSQMNQWLLTTANLPEGNLPLGRLLKDVLMPAGRRTAKIQYGKEGWVSHSVTNAWGYSGIINTPWSIFTTAGAWIASSLWDQYDTYRDKTFLKDVAYPVLRDSAVFFLDFLIENKDGYLVTAPSCSPENGDVGMMAACDRAIIHGLFESVIEASEILDVDEELRAHVKKALAALPPIRVSRHGQIMEWYDDITDGISNHRHTSHLLGLYPYSQITLEDTPELAKAAELSMTRRFTTPGWEETEFTGPNLAAFFARLKQGDEALKRIDIVKDKLTAPNFFTVSPAGIAGAQTDIFLIDGTMGIAAALGELLLQSYNDRVLLLPALPESFADGAVRGMTARGGLTVDFSWKEHKLVSARLTAKEAVTFTLCCNNLSLEMHLKAGESRNITLEDMKP
ncbi:MAG: glycosyl hydrolase family 95 catalytic domain-containing protein [Acutalibacteraceae bacterium]